MYKSYYESLPDKHKIVAEELILGNGYKHILNVVKVSKSTISDIKKKMIEMGVIQGKKVVQKKIVQPIVQTKVQNDVQEQDVPEIIEIPENFRVGKFVIPQEMIKSTVSCLLHLAAYLDRIRYKNLSVERGKEVAIEWARSEASGWEGLL